MYNKIQFIVANHTKPSGEKELVPRLKSGNAEELMDLYGDVRQSITGGTMVAMVKLIQKSGAELVGVACLMELEFFNPREILAGVTDKDLHSLVKVS